MYKIQTLNKISPSGLSLLPYEKYEAASEISNPDAILVRSFKMNDMVLPENLLANLRAPSTASLPVLTKYTLLSFRGKYLTRLSAYFT